MGIFVRVLPDIWKSVRSRFQINFSSSFEDNYQTDMIPLFINIPFLLPRYIRSISISFESNFQSDVTPFFHWIFVAVAMGMNYNITSNTNRLLKCLRNFFLLGDFDFFRDANLDDYFWPCRARNEKEIEMKNSHYNFLRWFMCDTWQHTLQDYRGSLCEKKHHRRLTSVCCCFYFITHKKSVVLISNGLVENPWLFVI